MKLHSLKTYLEQQGTPHVYLHGKTSANCEDPSKVVSVEPTNIGFQLKPIRLDIPYFDGTAFMVRYLRPKNFLITTTLRKLND